MKAKVKFNALDYSYREVADLSIRDINAAFRAVDDSHLWPICGKFNATERAINRIRRWRRQGMIINSGNEYAETLRLEIAHIVNVEM